MWVLAVILLVALMIPITAILVDSPVGRSVARRLDGQTDRSEGGRDATALERRVDALESDLADVTRALSSMREELQFVQRLLEDPNKKNRS